MPRLYGNYPQFTHFGSKILFTMSFKIKAGRQKQVNPSWMDGYWAK